MEGDSKYTNKISIIPGNKYSTCCCTHGGLQTEVTEQPRFPGSRLPQHLIPEQIMLPGPDSLLHEDLTTTCSPTSVAPGLPMAGTCHCSRSLGASCPHISRVTVSHLSATPSLPGPSVSFVFEAMTARDSHLPQGPLLMGGEGMQCFQ